MPTPTRRASARPLARRVPEATAAFWTLKGLSTAFGESVSDWAVHATVPQVAVAIGFLAFAGALALQFRMRRYVPAAYWFAVAMVGVFGTMAADVVHVALGVPYAASSVGAALVLAAVFVTWRRTEGTLSIHSVNTARAETFYWAAVMATFAAGTAIGDFSAATLHLGYLPSAALFAGLLVVPAAGYRFLGWDGVFSFWFAYVLTRPLGASLADGFGKPRAVSGLGLGDGVVALVLGAAIVVLVALVATRQTEQLAPEVA